MGAEAGDREARFTRLPMSRRVPGIFSLRAGADDIRLPTLEVCPHRSTGAPLEAEVHRATVHG